MARITLKDGLKFELHGQEYKLIERIPPGEWKILNVVTGRQSSLSENTIIDFLFKGELNFITAVSQQHIAFPDLNESERNNAIWREKYVTRVIEKGVYKSTLQALEPIIREVYSQLKISEEQCNIVGLRMTNSSIPSTRQASISLPNDLNPRIIKSLTNLNPAIA